MKEMIDDKIVEIGITSDEDVILARQKVRSVAQEMGFTPLDQTRLVTAVSELARNIVVHAKEGRISVFKEDNNRKGLKIIFEDNGPGIPDVEKAMEEGFSTANSMGIGLKGAKRLVDDFTIDSASGKGTRVEIIKWL